MTGRRACGTDIAALLQIAVCSGGKRASAKAVQTTRPRGNQSAGANHSNFSNFGAW
jgi:hypothetical protein